VQVLLLTLVASFLLSLLSAVLADAYLLERIPIVGDFVGLQLSHNAGIAWGMELPGGIQEVAILLALIAVFVLAFRAARSQLSTVNCLPLEAPRRGAKWGQLLAFGLILGGGMANVVDRFRDGIVTDYFQVGTFPIFNVADSCVTVGVILLLLVGGKGHV